MLQRKRELITVFLITLLPLHALAVTVLTKVVGEVGGPMAIIAIWKEMLLLIIVGFAFFEIIRRGFQKKFDALDALIVLALLYSLLIHPWDASNGKISYLYGFRYDFVPLIAFLILRRVQWSQEFWKAAGKVLVLMGSLVAVYGLLTLILPDRWFLWLGYSALHSLYIPDGPIAAFQFVSETGIRRIQSTFSGPNQLGLWLLLPFALSLRSKPMSMWRICSIVMMFAIFFTFSRAAWIGALVVVVLFLRSLVRRRAIALGVLAIIMIGISATLMFPTVILRPLSSSAHLARPLQAIRMIVDHPIGHGLGYAGPASNRISDACVFLPPESDTSWATPFPNLCVFVLGGQVQPTDRDCRCPVLPENWYLQWGVEMGVVGLIIALLIPFFVLRQLMQRKEGETFAVFIALSVAALFLHAFEDSAVSYTLWILLSGTLPLWRVQKAPSSSSISADSTLI